MKIDKICREIIFGQCPNLNKYTWNDNENMECPYCIRINGKDGFGNQVIDSDIAQKIIQKLNERKDR